MTLTQAKQHQTKILKPRPARVGKAEQNSGMKYRLLQLTLPKRTNRVLKMCLSCFRRCSRRACILT